MTTKRPVAFVVETLSPSGGVRVILELCNRLVDRDWDVSIWSVNPKELGGWFRIDSRVKYRSFFRTGSTVDYAPLADVLKKQDCIKISTFYRTAFATADASKEGEGYYLVQDIESSYTSQPVMAQQVMSTYQMPLRKFTTSKWVQSQLPDCEYMGIGLSNMYRPNPKLRREKWILAIARLQALKGWDTLCEACRYLDAANGKIKLFGLHEKLPMFTKTDYIVHPSDEKVRQLYQTAGCFMSQTAHEGFGLPMLEAMATACPVSCTDADGNREFIEDGENCLVAENNSPYRLAENCARILNDKELAIKLGVNGVKTAARYRWLDCIIRLENLLLQ